MPGTIEIITWTVLMARWTDFARAALALPADGEGARWRTAVPDVIALQALTHSLAEIDTIADQTHRAATIDLAEVQVRRHAESVHAHWRGERLPLQLVELVEDAHVALRAARCSGVEYIVAVESLVSEHPAELVGELLESGFTGDLYVPTPGVPIFSRSPAVFTRGRAGVRPAPEHLSAIREFFPELDEGRRLPCLRQVYRQFDFGKGRAVRDLVVHEFEELPGGQPLLVPAIIAGEARAVTLPIRGAADQDRLPLEFSRSEAPG